MQFSNIQETRDSLEDAISDMSEWVAGFAGTFLATVLFRDGCELNLF